MKARWIKASELGEYLYCQRAWWYRLQGIRSANVQELAHGTAQHLRHNRGLRWASWQRLLAFVLIVAAFVLFLFQLMQ
ncbi:MAG: hypothetical protein M1347_07745 [Chloroflexi bacterium]|nr:hypothetical protein [Chloroflexota bacterium]